MKQAESSYVYNIDSNSSEGFGFPNVEWKQKMQRAGALCSHCDGMNWIQIQKMKEVIIDVERPPRTHLSGVGDLRENIIFSRQLVDLLGSKRIERLGRIVPLVNAGGRVFSEFCCVLVDETRTPGCVRGHTPTQVFLCKTCGRLKYWPGWPPSKWYLLQREWPDGMDLACLGFVLCSPRLWENVVGPAKLNGLKANKLPIQDEPLDGWPADYGELIAELNRRDMRQ